MPSGAPARRVLVVAVCTLATGLGSSLGFVFGFLTPLLQQDLALSRAAAGLLVGVFFGATGLGSILGGRLTERLGGRSAVVLTQLVAAAAALLGAAVASYPALLVASAAGGLAYAVVTPATNLVIAVSVPPGRHGLGLAVRTAGVPVLVATSSLLSTQLGEQIGWRPVLGGVVPAFLATAGAAWHWLPDARSNARSGTVAAPLPPRFGWFPVACLLLIAGSQPLFSWSVPYLHNAVGATLPAAGRLVAMGALVGVAVMVLVAWRSDRVAPAARLPAVVVLCIVTAGGQLLLATGQGLALASFAIVLATACQLGAISLMHAAVVAAAPAAVGRATGVTMTGYYLGALLAPPLFGRLVDATGGYVLPWLGCALLTVAAAACFARCRRIAPASLRR